MDKEHLPIPPENKFLFQEDVWFTVSQLNEKGDAHAIREPHHYEDVISYVFDRPEGIVIFDVGFGLADIRKIIKKLIPSKKPIKIFLTHSDWDHIGGLKNFSKEFPDVSIEIFIFDPTNKHTQPYGLDRLKQGWTLTEMGGLIPEHFTQEFRHKNTLPSQKALDAFTIPGILDAQAIEFPRGERTVTFEAFGFTIIALKTPGHTPDSVCYFIKETGDLITGDTLYPGPEYLHMPGSDIEEYLESLEFIVEYIASIGGEIKRILPGHNNPISKPSLLTAHIKALTRELAPVSTLLDKDQFGMYVRRNYVTEDGEHFALMEELIGLSKRHILQDLFLTIRENPGSTWHFVLERIVRLLEATITLDAPEEDTTKGVLDKENFVRILKREVVFVNHLIEDLKDPTFDDAVDTDEFAQALATELRKLWQEIKHMTLSEQMLYIEPIITIRRGQENPWDFRDAPLPDTSKEDEKENEDDDYAL